MSQRQKQDGVVYTPPDIVDLILDRCQFSARRSWGRTLIDPACGAGAFLLPAAERLILGSQSQGRSATEIVSALENNIVGADIDQQAINSCRQQLQQIADKYQLGPVSWRLYHGDSLTKFSDWDLGEFDLVVGNPPYVRIQNLGPRRRAEIQDNWSVCRRGAADLFLAFFQFGLQLLAPSGFLGYITPRSYFSSQAGQELRQLLIANDYLREIIDFGGQQIFPEVSTYTAITIARRQRRRKKPTVVIDQRDSDRPWKETIDPDQLATSPERWALVNNADRQFLIDCQQRGPTLGEMTDIRVGLATLADRCYLLSGSLDKSSAGLVTMTGADGQKIDIEPGLLVAINKVSRMSNNNQDQKLYIIFPYHRQPGKQAQPFTDQYFADNFPAGYHYLQQRRDILQRRGHQTKQWFEYGSSQGIQTCFGAKILVPPLSIDGRLFLQTNKQFTYFSGYGIFFSGQLSALFQRLQQEDFRRYLLLSGREYRGQYRAINKNLIKPFSLTTKEWRALGAKC